MYLKSLEINGFKSFAKKADLSFQTPITAIVGPNGSGKSNVAEAFRFVLGEQSFKSMRGKKGEDLIFSGSNESGRANRASTKIVFDNTKRFLNIDFDEVSVERTVFRDGVNEYSINGSRVRLKDVLELLAGAHIGASGHHIISQGEADRILNSNVRERKTMIEDALGLKIFQYKREESERKLEKTEENIKSVESLRREISPHIKFLKKQVEKVEKAIEMKNRLSVLYKEYLKRENIYITEAKSKIAAEKSPIEKKLETLEKDLNKAKSVLEKSKSHDQKSDHIIKLEESIRKARDKKDEFMREIGRTEGAIASEERILKREKEMSKSLETNVSLREVEDLASEISEHVDSAEKETDASALKKIINSIRGLIKEFVARQKQKTTSQNISDSEKVLKGLRDKKADLDKEITTAQRDEEKLSAEYSALRKEIDEEKDTNRAAEKSIFEVMTAQNEVIAERNIIRAREDALRIEEEDYKRELGEAGAIIGREVLDFDHFIIGGHPPAGGENRQSQHERRRELEKIKIRLEESGAGSSEEVMKEFKEVSERDMFLARELEDLDKSAEALRSLIVDLGEKISSEFSAGLDKINKQFEEFFSLMFGGGTAKLVLIKEKKRRPVISEDMETIIESSEEEAEVEEGIDISVSLPRKKIKGLMMLSGGERALTSIALIFAMSQVKPPPFIILDETDAALDEANSKKYGDMVENLAKYSQLILITHNRETMSRAGVLYGVTMLSGVSKLLSIQFDEALAVAK